ncbi:MAG: ABC transporter permease subunit [Planctomycetia bacterium]|nr:ABC transporter permease subunit [Planctomycetia bacterium]
MLFAVWYNWIAPLWLVAAGAAAVTAAMFAVYFLLVLVAPKVAAIARTTAKEAWAQPLFWVELVPGIILLMLFPFIPYNTFGEDVKVVKDSGLTMIMVLSILLAVWTASVSVADEIEGRTALTLLSKPVGRRQFIFGKFLGVIAPALSMFIVLGAVFLGTVSYKVKHEARETSNPEPTWQECQKEMVQVVPGLVLAFLETVTMASIAVALSTRLSMVPNLLICATIYVLGHLAPVFANAFGNSQLVAFFGQFIATVLPNLEDFNVQAAVSTGEPIPLVYVGWAAIYCALYSTVAMLLALLLFEDRDLA